MGASVPRFASPVTSVALFLSIGLFASLTSGTMEGTQNAQDNRTGRGQLLPTLSAPSPSEVLATDLREPVGVAVAPNGRVYFTDERRGAVLEIAGPGTGATLITDTLARPRGLLLEDPNHLLIAADCREGGCGARINRG